MAAEARRLAPEMGWPVVAERVSASGRSAPRRAARRWYDRDDAGSQLRPPAAADRPSRHLRARLSRRAAPEHGYCTDDMARVLVVATREPDAERPLNGLAGVRLRFLGDAQASTAPTATGWTARVGGTTSRPLEDCWGQMHLGARHGRRAQRRRLGAQVGHHSVRARRPGSGRPGRGRWRSRPWAPPSCSPSTPTIARRASSSPTTPRRSPHRAATRPGRGPSRDSPTPTPSSPRR